MRILDNETGKPLVDIGLYLTPSEAREMSHALDHLLTKPEDHHIHLNDEGYQREVTLAVYTEGNLNEFDEQSRRLITGLHARL